LKTLDGRRVDHVDRNSSDLDAERGYKKDMNKKDRQVTLREPDHHGESAGGLKPGTLIVELSQMPRILRYMGIKLPSRIPMKFFLDSIDFFHRGVLDFNLFMSAIRNLRESLLKQVFRPVFEGFDTDKSGSVSIRQIPDVICDCGFTVTRSVVTELCEYHDIQNPETPWSEEKQLAQQLKPWYPSRKEPVYENEAELFAAILKIKQGGSNSPPSLRLAPFVELCLGLIESQGFAPSELVELKAQFDRSSGGKGRLAFAALRSTLRYLGFNLTLDSTQKHSSQIDVTKKGYMLQHEFNRFVRVCRDSDSDRVRSAFKRVGGQSCSLNHKLFVQRHQVEFVVAQANIETELKIGWLEQCEAKLELHNAKYNLLDVFSIYRELKSSEANDYKRRAGFSDGEVVEFRERFNHFDKDLSGTLSGGEIFKILEQCGFEPKTRDEQSNIAALLEACLTK
jgi:Ca2+-binding EF-hand superfamily protein